MEAAYKAMKEHEDWRQLNLPVQLTPDVQQMLESGIIYMSGRDNRYRPIVVMNLKLFDEKRTELIIRTFTYFFEEIIEHVLLPGQVEQWVTIMNVEGFSLFSLPLGVPFVCYLGRKEASQSSRNALPRSVVPIVFGEFTIDCVAFVENRQTIPGG